MTGYVIGFADFRCDLDLVSIASILTTKVFGAIRFVPKDGDEDYQLGILCLEHAFMGIQVDLFGSDGEFTLELATILSASVADCSDVADVSPMLKQQLAAISQFRLFERNV